MEGTDCFKCSMCQFLLKENEKLRDQLYMLSISLDQKDNEFVSKASQTTGSVTLENGCQTDKDCATATSQTEHCEKCDTAADSVIDPYLSLSSNSPYHTMPGKPFAEFDVDKLASDSTFETINGREVKYYGDFSYSYGKTSHKPCPIPENS